MSLDITKINRSISVVPSALGGQKTPESIELKVTAACNLNEFALRDSTFREGHKLSNRLTHTFWFPSQTVKAGDEVVVNSGKKPDVYINSVDIPGTQNKAYLFYWDLAEHVWNKDGDIAYIYRVEQIAAYSVASFANR